jgi:peptidoglycan/xylan/chitin deacetylase (PgdA/CDA1 family)
VNDNKDPFSPAISTELFERQMRFLVRYYKVVALSELLDRVGENSSEPVIAITFDDGYQDNYEHAFPILRRYNLPATIFLTTGSIDTRKLLWFEELAQAIKNSPLEFLDVEIDLPRRFWLRTERERLDCNAQLFQLMRRLPDSGRRQLLAHVLRQLAIPSSEPNGNALTWDQARLMQKHGIDFGGHTVTHPFLSKLTGEQLVWEVSECKRRIEEELQRPIAHFAYPNGRDEDFCEWNSEAIRKAGYRAAATTIWGVNDQSTDPMQLRRGGPWEETPALFAYKLDWYQLTNG